MKKQTALTALLVIAFWGSLQAGDNVYRVPTYNVLSKWMNQPCEETLAGIQYTEVTDENYQVEVLNSDKPVMVHFYSNRSKGSQGLTALARVLGEAFPQIKLCSYKLSDRGNISSERFDALKRNYLLEESPAILFYDNDKGQMEYVGQCSGGINIISSLDRLIKNYMGAIPEHILD